MSKPDVVLLTTITTFIINSKETSVSEIADRYDLSIDDAIDAIKTILLTEVEGRTNHYFLDFYIDAEETEDGTDVVYSADDAITYQPTEYDDSRVYLTSGEAAVSIEMLDQLLKLVAPGTPSARSLTTVRDKIQGATGQSIGAGPPEPRGSGLVLDAVWDALRNSRMLTFNYHGPGEYTERVTQRTVIPCAVVSEVEGYLAALQDGKNLRWFRLDRMSNAVAGKPFTQTDANRARRTLKNHPDLHPSEGELVTFTTKPRAIWFAEATPGATVVEKNNQLEIRVRAVSATWVRNSALRIGTDLIDIAPASMKQAAIEQAKKILEAQ